MRVIGLDPGTTQSAIVEWDGERVLDAQTLENNELRGYLSARQRVTPAAYLVIEQIEHMGMPAGKELFETVFWSGRFYERWHACRDRVTRREVKLHLCKTMRAKDGNVQQALIDRFGGKGTKKSPGPMYGVSGHAWQALAVAVTYWDRLEDTLPF